MGERMVDKISVTDENFQDAALQAFRKSGAVILTNLESVKGSLQSWESFCADVVPRLLFADDELLLKKHTASAVHAEQDGLQELKGKALPPHTDGYVWGDYYPDIVFLVCEECDANGGENYLIDGHEVVDQLDDTTIETLKHALVDHTERSSDGMAQGVTAINPVLQYSKTDGSLMWRRMVPAKYLRGNCKIFDADGDSSSVYASLWQPAECCSDNPASVLAALHVLDKVINHDDMKAARFRLERGEVLIVNNYRMLHAREGFSAGTRRTWRIWAWTNRSNGLPPDVQNEAPATLLSAEKFIQNSSLSTASGTPSTTENITEEQVVVV
jgi:alpha-ketoglutarate-dependent taurine dioxygenase